MKAIALGIWAVVVALGAAYGAAVLWPAHLEAAAKPEAVALDHQKTRALNVPILADGIVQGFVSMQFDMSLDAKAMKTLGVAPEAYLLDEAFRTIYADPNFDFHNLKKYDLTAFTHRLVEGSNARLGVPLIKDVLIVDFSYISKDSMSGG